MLEDHVFCFVLHFCPQSHGEENKAIYQLNSHSLEQWEIKIKKVLLRSCSWETNILKDA